MTNPALSTVRQTTLAIALVASSHASGASTRVIDAFDAAVSQGLPRTVHIGDGDTRRRGNDPAGALTIMEAIPVEVRLPDGTEARTYRATLDGHPAVVTRSTDHLDVTVPHRTGVEITGFDAQSDDPHRLTEEARTPAPAHTPPPVGSTVPLSARQVRNTRDLSFLDPNDAQPTLTFWLFLHDDTAGASRQHVHAGYVSWWLADLQRLLPSHRLRTYYIDRRAGMTDIVYGDRHAAMDAWSRAAHTYATQAKLPYVPGRNEYKFMLIVKDQVAPSTNGLAWHGGDQAIASLAGSWSIVAHEFGHTLTGIHDDSAMWWSYVWPCATNLYPTNYGLVSNCYRYTTDNERRIVQYASRKTDDPLPVDPSRHALTMVD